MRELEPKMRELVVCVREERAQAGEGEGEGEERARAGEARARAEVCVRERERESTGFASEIERERELGDVRDQERERELGDNYNFSPMEKAKHQFSEGDDLNIDAFQDMDIAGSGIWGSDY
ncbi:unnamed protein product, partial [Brassica napus]